MTHEDAQQLLSALALNELDAETRAQLLAHVEQCAQCERDLEGLRATFGVLKDAAAALPDTELTPERLGPLFDFAASADGGTAGTGTGRVKLARRAQHALHRVRVPRRMPFHVSRSQWLEIAAVFVVVSSVVFVSMSAVWRCALGSTQKAVRAIQERSDIAITEGKSLESFRNHRGTEGLEAKLRVPELRLTLASRRRAGEKGAKVALHSFGDSDSYSAATRDTGLRTREAAPTEAGAGTVAAVSEFQITASGSGPAAGGMGMGGGGGGSFGAGGEMGGMGGGDMGMAGVASKRASGKRTAGMFFGGMGGAEGGGAGAGMGAAAAADGSSANRIAINGAQRAQRGLSLAAGTEVTLSETLGEPADQLRRTASSARKGDASVTLESTPVATDPVSVAVGQVAADAFQVKAQQTPRRSLDLQPTGETGEAGAATGGRESSRGKPPAAARPWRARGAAEIAGSTKGSSLLPPVRANEVRGLPDFRRGAPAAATAPASDAEPARTRTRKKAKSIDWGADESRPAGVAPAKGADKVVVHGSRERLERAEKKLQLGRALMEYAAPAKPAPVALPSIAATTAPTPATPATKAPAPVERLLVEGKKAEAISEQLKDLGPIERSFVPSVKLKSTKAAPAAEGEMAGTEAAPAQVHPNFSRSVAKLREKRAAVEMQTQPLDRPAPAAEPESQPRQARKQVLPSAGAGMPASREANERTRRTEAEMDKEHLALRRDKGKAGRLSDELDVKLTTSAGAVMAGEQVVAFGSLKGLPSAGQVRRQPQSPDAALLQEAQTAHREGELAKAFESVKQLLIEHPDSKGAEQAHALVREIRQKQGQMVAALVVDTNGNGVEEDEELPPAPRQPPPPVNPFVLTAKDRLSTFALEADTASYSMTRRYLRKGYRPPPGVVRMEEFINAFDYNYPRQSTRVFTVHSTAAPAPFGQGLYLLKIGVRGKVVGRDGRKASHLVFVVDASGSMGREDRMPLVKYAISLLLDQLDQRDRVTLLAYGTQPRLLVEATPATDKARVRQAIEAIECGASTNMQSGIELGYQLAARHFRAGEINRVILCSDGVANVGPTDAETLLKKVESYRKQGITFTSVGVGAGSYDDRMLELLANKGDGNYVFVDTMAEARRVFSEELSATLQTIAKDVKIQVDFDPTRVYRYRLIGYENRAVADQDFRNDAVDAGEIGSGQSATALYEFELTGGRGDQLADLGTVYVRYRDLDSDRVEEFSSRLGSALIRDREPRTDPRYCLAACAAEFAEILRGSDHAQGGTLQGLEQVMIQVANALPLDTRVQELLALVQRAQGLPQAK